MASIGILLTSHYFPRNRRNQLTSMRTEGKHLLDGEGSGFVSRQVDSLKLQREPACDE